MHHRHQKREAILKGCFSLFLYSGSNPRGFAVSFLRLYRYDRWHHCQKTNSTSHLGNRLDTIADLIFMTASLLKLLPAIHIPRWLWIWGGVIALIKISNIIYGYIAIKQFIFLHTIMNKITGLLLFLLPLSISFVELKLLLLL